MKRTEYARLAGVLALAVAGACIVGLEEPWFEYETSSGRQTPPGSPFTMEDDGVVRHRLTFWADRWEGDATPSDPELAERFQDVATTGTLVVAGAASLVALGEIPGIHRVIGRRVSLFFITAAIAVAIGVVVSAFIWLPESMAGHGVDSPYTSRLDEPEGYTHTRLSLGWYTMALVPLLLVPTWLLKYQAGSHGLEWVEAVAGKEGRG